jgi:hypothetical protein
VRPAARTLDFSRLVVIMLLGIMHFINDDDELQQIVDRLLAGVPSGSTAACRPRSTSGAGSSQTLALRAGSWLGTCAPCWVTRCGGPRPGSRCPTVARRRSGWLGLSLSGRVE